MQLKDLIDLQMKLDERFVFFWNFYIIFVTATLGFIFTQVKQMTDPLRGILILGYFIFIGMNILGLSSVNKLQIATNAEIKRQSNFYPDTITFINNLCFRNYKKERKWIFIVHLLSGLIVVSIILNR